MWLVCPHPFHDLGQVAQLAYAGTQGKFIRFPGFAQCIILRTV